jgi:LmbE family N-acetylglucosaminyl deacetylase
VFVDISDVIEKKLELVGCHESQTSRGRLVSEDAVRARATLHGIHAGFEFAELFEPVRLAWTGDVLPRPVRRMDQCSKR